MFSARAVLIAYFALSLPCFAGAAVRPDAKSLSRGQHAHSLQRMKSSLVLRQFPLVTHERLVTRGLEDTQELEADPLGAALREELRSVIEEQLADDEPLREQVASDPLVN